MDRKVKILIGPWGPFPTEAEQKGAMLISCFEFGSINKNLFEIYLGPHFRVFFLDILLFK